MARYFALLGLLFLAGFWYSQYSFKLLRILGPVFFLAAWLRVHAAVLFQFLPNEPFYNNYFLLIPVTIVYFGFIGLQIKNILNEIGLIRPLSLIVFLAFLVYIHYLSFQELQLYWPG